MRSNFWRAARALCLTLFAVHAYAQEADKYIAFSEVWAYAGEGDESSLTFAYPVTDVAFFCANINNSGKLVNGIDVSRIASFKGRKHLVVAELGNLALTHFVLTSEYGLRDPLIEDIAAASASYDGVSIDFEAVLSKDKDAFIDFLALLKKRLDTKILSIALPARFRMQDDAYDYERIGKIVDRVVVMAYDEHWSTSAPGPIASTDWCANVCSYALAKIDPTKLIMGIPFYGRAWPDKSLSRAYKYAGVSRLLAEKKDGKTNREKDIPSLEYQELVTVRLYYEDALSIFSKLMMYKSLDAKSVAFWRLGQEDPAVWQLFKPTK